MLNILVTGGAGFKGTLLVDALIRAGHKVTLLDNFVYGFEPALSLALHPKCTVVRKDLRNLSQPDVDPFDIVYHLAAISGYPACEANPHSAQEINVESTVRLAKMLREDQILVYASTTSMYGQSSIPLTETARPAPVSLYGMTKYAGENACRARKNSVAFRFATLFGTSLKMRCDLLPNDFTYRAVVDRSIVLFDSKSVRTFLHVRDAIRAYLMVAEDPTKFVGEIFNIGDNRMNFSKLEIAQKIAEFVRVDIVQSSLEDLDRRDFVISFDKINKLGFSAEKDLGQGIQELISLFSWFRPFSPYKTI